MATIERNDDVKIFDSLPPKEDRDVLNLSSPNILSTLEGLQTLVVDDNEDVLFLTSIMLEDYGAVVMTAPSASEAFKIFSQMKPDILISDLAMPGEDGYSLIRKIRNLSPEEGGLIPAIALTASARDQDHFLSLEAGFQVHLAKPIDFEELVRVVADLAKRSQ